MKKTRYLCVHDLPAKHRDNDIRDVFERLANVQDIRFFKEGYSRHAIVTFTDIKSAASVVNAGIKIKDVHLKLDYCDSSIPHGNNTKTRDTSNGSIKFDFKSEDLWKVKPVHKPSHEYVQSSEVDFQSLHKRSEERSFDNFVHTVQPLRAVQNSPLSPRETPNWRGLKLSHLPPLDKLSDEHLRQNLFTEFRRCGRIQSVVLPSNYGESDGASVRVAIITFRRPDEARRAHKAIRTGEKILFSTSVVAELHPGFNEEYPTKNSSSLTTTTETLIRSPHTTENPVPTIAPSAGNKVFPTSQNPGSDKTVITSKCPTRTLYVGGLTTGPTGPVTSEQLSAAFKKFGDIIDVQLHATSNSAFIQFIEMRGPTRAMNAHARDPLRFGGRPLHLAYVPSSPNTNLWFSELPMSLAALSDVDLFHTLDKIVPIQEITLINRTDRSQSAQSPSTSIEIQNQPTNCAAYIRLNSIEHASKLLLDIRSRKNSTEYSSFVVKDNYPSASRRPFAVDFASPRQTTLVHSLHLNAARSGESTRIRVLCTANGLKDAVSKQQSDSVVAKHSKWKVIIEPRSNEHITLADRQSTKDLEFDGESFDSHIFTDARIHKADSQSRRICFTSAHLGRTFKSRDVSLSGSSSISSSSLSSESSTESTSSSSSSLSSSSVSSSTSSGSSACTKPTRLLHSDTKPKSEKPRSTHSSECSRRHRTRTPNKSKSLASKVYTSSASNSIVENQPILHGSLCIDSNPINTRLGSPRFGASLATLRSSYSTVQASPTLPSNLVELHTKTKSKQPCINRSSVNTQSGSLLDSSKSSLPVHLLSSNASSGVSSGGFSSSGSSPHHSLPTSKPVTFNTLTSTNSSSIPCTFTSTALTTSSNSASLASPQLSGSKTRMYCTELSSGLKLHLSTTTSQSDGNQSTSHQSNPLTLSIKIGSSKSSPSPALASPTLNTSFNFSGLKSINRTLPSTPVSAPPISENTTKSSSPADDKISMDGGMSSHSLDWYSNCSPVYESMYDKIKRRTNKEAEERRQRQLEAKSTKEKKRRKQCKKEEFPLNKSPVHSIPYTPESLTSEYSGNTALTNCSSKSNQSRSNRTSTKSFSSTTERSRKKSRDSFSNEFTNWNTSKSHTHFWPPTTSTHSLKHSPRSPMQSNHRPMKLERETSPVSSSLSSDDALDSSPPETLTRLSLGMRFPVSATYHECPRPSKTSPCEKWSVDDGILGPLSSSLSSSSEHTAHDKPIHSEEFIRSSTQNMLNGLSSKSRDSKPRTMAKHSNKLTNRRKDLKQAHRTVSDSTNSWNPKYNVDDVRTHPSISRSRDPMTVSSKTYPGDRHSATKSGVKRSKQISTLPTPPKRVRTLFDNMDNNVHKMTSGLKSIYDDKADSPGSYLSNKTAVMYAQIRDMEYATQLSPTKDCQPNLHEVDWNYSRHHSHRLSADAHSGTDDSSLPVTRSPSPMQYRNLFGRDKRTVSDSAYGLHIPMDLSRTDDSVFDSDQFSTTSKSTPSTEPMEQEELVERSASLKFSDDEWHSNGESSSPQPHLDFDGDYCQVDKTEQSSTTYQSNSFSSQMLSPVGKSPPSPEDSEDETVHSKKAMSLSSEESRGEKMDSSTLHHPTPTIVPLSGIPSPVIPPRSPEVCVGKSETFVTPTKHSPVLVSNEVKMDFENGPSFSVTEMREEALSETSPITNTQSSVVHEPVAPSTSDVNNLPSSEDSSHAGRHISDSDVPPTNDRINVVSEPVLQSISSTCIEPIAVKDVSAVTSVLCTSEPSHPTNTQPISTLCSDVKTTSIKYLPTTTSHASTCQVSVSRRQKSTSESQKSALSPVTKPPMESCDITRYVQSVIERVKAERVGETQTTTNSCLTSTPVPIASVCTSVPPVRSDAAICVNKRSVAHRKSLLTTSTSILKPNAVATSKLEPNIAVSGIIDSHPATYVSVSISENLSPVDSITSSPLPTHAGIPLPSIPGVNACAPLAVSGRVTRQSQLTLPSNTKIPDVMKPDPPCTPSNPTTHSTRRRRRSDGKNVQPSTTKDVTAFNTVSEVLPSADPVNVFTGSTLKVSSDGDDVCVSTRPCATAASIHSRSFGSNDLKPPCVSVDPYEPNFDEESPPGFDHSQLHHHRAASPAAASPSLVVTKIQTPKPVSTITTLSPVPLISCPSPISSVSSHTGSSLSHASVPIVPTTVAPITVDSVDEVIREVCAGQFDVQSYLNGWRSENADLVARVGKETYTNPKTTTMPFTCSLPTPTSQQMSSASVKPFALGLTSEPVVAAVTIPVCSTASVNNQTGLGKNGPNNSVNLGASNLIINILQALQLIPGSQVTMRSSGSSVGLSGAISATTITLPVNAAHQAAEKIKAAVLSATSTATTHPATVASTANSQVTKKNTSTTLPSKLLNVPDLAARIGSTYVPITTTTPSVTNVQNKPTHFTSLVTSSHLNTPAMISPSKRIRQTSGPSVATNLLPPKSIDLGLSSVANAASQLISHQFSGSGGLSQSTSTVNCAPAHANIAVSTSSSFVIGHTSLPTNSIPPSTNLLNIAGRIPPFVSSPSQPMNVASQQPTPHLGRPNSASVCARRSPPISTTAISNSTMQSIIDQLSGLVDPSVLLTLAQAGGFSDTHLLNYLRHFARQLTTNEAWSNTGPTNKTTTSVDTHGKSTTAVNATPLSSCSTNSQLSKPPNERTPLSSTSPICINTTLHNDQLGRSIDSNALISPPVSISRPIPPSTIAPVSDSAMAAGEALWNSINHTYPLVWQGWLSLKNAETRVALHYIYGNSSLLHDCMRLLAAGGGGQSQYSLVSSGGPLRIVQRMRLEPSQLEGVQRKIHQDGASCMCLALPAGNGPIELMQQTQILNENFIRYMQEKMAAGIINVGFPDCQQGLCVVHIFPPCEFSHTQLNRAARDLHHRVLQANQSHLLVVITTVW